MPDYNEAYKNLDIIVSKKMTIKNQNLHFINSRNL